MEGIMNTVFADILFDLACWMLIVVGLLGFMAVVWESVQGYRRERRTRRAWQRMPGELTARQNVRLHKVI
jgi:F0F1-type ATP synthase assembly protein I